MTQKIKVFKFGGSSLKNVAAIKNVGHIIKAHLPEQMVIVVSAMGKTTNRLEAAINLAFTDKAAGLDLLQRIYEDHYAIAQELLGAEVVIKGIDKYYAEAVKFVKTTNTEAYDFFYDQIIYLGEIFSSLIVSAYLNENILPTRWVDARSVVLTDEIYREGWVQWKETMANTEKEITSFVSKDKLVLTQGFIASNKKGKTVTLGREGSDYTAAILSFCLNAEDMTIWKDVDGVLTADPRKFDNTTKLDRLSYREAIEMTYYGAKVIHPKTIKPLQNKSIPLYVKSFLAPNQSGTLISNEVEDKYPPMVAVEDQQAILQISTRDFSFVAEHHMNYLFSIIAELRLQVNLMQNTAISFSVCVNDTDDKVNRFAEKIQKDFKVLIDRNLQLISVRHYQPEVLENLKKGKIVLLEAMTGKTVQMVVKDMLVVNWKK